MKSFLGILVFIVAIIGLVVALQLVMMNQMVLDDPWGWDGGRGLDAVILAVAIFGIGGGFLGLASLLGVFGAFFGAKRRKGAYWLLVLPGFIGLIIAVLSLAALILLQPGGMEVAPLIGAALGIPPLVFWLSGMAFRKANPKKAAPPPLPS